MLVMTHNTKIEDAKIDVRGTDLQQFFCHYSDIKLKINWESLVPNIDESGTLLMQIWKHEQKINNQIMLLSLFSVQLKSNYFTGFIFTLFFSVPGWIMCHLMESEERHVHREVEQGLIISLNACLTGNIKYHQESFENSTKKLWIESQETWILVPVLPLSSHMIWTNHLLFY